MNQADVVVSNASPLIALDRIGYLDLLPALVESVFIPVAVKQEVYKAIPPPPWVVISPVTQPLGSEISLTNLGSGEREAISLAVKLQAKELIIDDLPARRLAQKLDIAIIGTVGLLLRAKRRNLIPRVRPLLDGLQMQEFRVSKNLYAAALSAAGED